MFILHFLHIIIYLSSSFLMVYMLNNSCIFLPELFFYWHKGIHRKDKSFDFENWQTGIRVSWVFFLFLFDISICTYMFPLHICSLAFRIYTWDIFFNQTQYCCLSRNSKSSSFIKREKQLMAAMSQLWKQHITDVTSFLIRLI